MNRPTPNDLLPVERDYLMKERSTLIDRIAFVERRLGLPSSITPKRERRMVECGQRQRPEGDNGR